MKTLTKQWDSLDAEDTQKLQLNKLRHYLSETVLPFSKHYNPRVTVDPLDIQTFADFSYLPFTSKRDLTEATSPKEFVLIPDQAVLKKRPSAIARALFTGKVRTKAHFEREFRPILMTSTTGRSADPVPFFYTQLDLDHLATAGTRLMEVCDSRAEFRHMNLFPYAPHLAFWQAHYAGLGFNTFTLSSGGGKVMGTDGNVRLLGKILPDALIGMPTFIYHVLQVAVERGLRVPNIRKIVLGGEKVPAGTRRKLRSLCAELGSNHVDIMATYGFTEAKMAFPECPFPAGAVSGGYHLYPDLGIVEVIDPESGIPVGEGEPGEIVWTPLDSRGSIVIRYRTGDHIDGGLVHSKCPHCHRTLPRLLGNISRVSDVRRMHIDKIKGTLVNFNDLEHVLDDIDDIGSWQIELRKRNDDPLEVDELIVHVAPMRRVDAETLTLEIERQFLAATELKPNRVEFYEASEMRKLQGVGKELKEQKLVDHREPAVSETCLEPLTPENS